MQEPHSWTRMHKPCNAFAFASLLLLYFFQNSEGGSSSFNWDSGLHNKPIYNHRKFLCPKPQYVPLNVKKQFPLVTAFTSLAYKVMKQLYNKLCDFDVKEMSKTASLKLYLFCRYLYWMSSITYILESTSPFHSSPHLLFIVPVSLSNLYVYITFDWKQ